MINNHPKTNVVPAICYINGSTWKSQGENRAKYGRFPMKNVALHNLGCKVNSYETEKLQQLLRENGFSIVPYDEKADIYIVNTCTVTNIADHKSRQMLHRAKAINPVALVVALGCYVDSDKGKVDADPLIDLAIPNSLKDNLIPILQQEIARLKKQGDSIICKAEDRSVMQKIAKGTNHRHTRAFLKIQDGCNQFCTYCIIPYVRGRVISRRKDEILREAARLVASGVKEIVLTGIHICSYGTDCPENGDLFSLLEALCTMENMCRIRLGSLEPGSMTREHVSRLGKLPNLCPHFHLSLQSGCEETLRRMNRHYTPGEYYQSLEYLRSTFDHPAITTDVIVGFPGETEGEFQETYRFLEKANLYELHVFPYSRRKGTIAAGMADQVPGNVAKERSNCLMALSAEHAKAYRSCYIGKEVPVLFEENKEFLGNAYYIGHTPNYLKVGIISRENLENTVQNVEISGFLSDEILNSVTFH
jgi:threonylcarbamoyladenosine tRNA methylthiotransferase MtaB